MSSGRPGWRFEIKYKKKSALWLDVPLVVPIALWRPVQALPRPEQERHCWGTGFTMTRRIMLSLNPGLPLPSEPQALLQQWQKQQQLEIAHRPSTTHWTHSGWPPPTSGESKLPSLSCPLRHLPWHCNTSGKQKKASPHSHHPRGTPVLPDASHRTPQLPDRSPDETPAFATHWGHAQREQILSKLQSNEALMPAYP